ncbi:MAG TPA: cysteine synthase family protein [Candidatus Mcinerneyibacterium sp.]|nr:cysteine synthase family protein [Candidatus Mcinerneyibacterium sp.]
MYKNILKTIGNTPIIKINKLMKYRNINIFAKLEWFNPGGSIKDRIAYKMIEEAENIGVLTKNKTIIEASSGNTAIGLALVAKLKNYNFTAVISSNVSSERKTILKAYGANFIETPACEKTDGAIKKVNNIITSYPEKYFNPDQYKNKYNYLTHYENTGPEIWEDLSGNIDYFVTGIGTSGTIMGIGNFLKEKNNKIKIIAIQPEKNHNIYGLKNLEESIMPEIYDRSIIDETIEVKTKEAVKYKNLLMEKEGLFVGYSSGANIYGALKISQNIDNGNIVTIFPDNGNRYLSIDV